MNKQEAIEAMEAGQKVSHKWFTSEEWMTMQEGYIIFEDGCQCTPREFWQSRVDASWEDDWKIFDGTTTVPNDYRKFGRGFNDPVKTYRPIKTWVRPGRKIGRNDLCPCGSGLKYKRCHLNK